jgi:hypothetical protein
MANEVIVFEGIDAAGHAVTYSVTVPVTATVDRSTLVYGTYEPLGGYTAGLVDPNPVGGWTVMGNGVSVNLNTPNAVYTNVIFNGTIVVGALGIEAHNCKLLGPSNPSPTGTSQMVRGTGAAPVTPGLGGIKFVDCLMDPQVQSWWSYSATGGWFTMERCELRNLVDGIAIGAPTTVDQPTNVLGCHIHDATYFSWTPPGGDGHSDGHTHNDGIQIGKGKGITIRGNKIGGPASTTSDPNDGHDYPGSGIIIGQAGSNTAADKIEYVVVDKNYFEGSVCDVNLNRAFGNSLDTVQVTNNQHAPGKPAGTYYIIKPNAPYFGGVVSGNVYQGTSTPVPITRGADGS